MLTEPIPVFIRCPASPTIQVNLTATDIDNTELAFSILAGPTNGTLSFINGSVVTYTPSANFNGSDSFTFNANDRMVDSKVATVSITVAPLNDTPDAVNDSASTAEEVSVTVFVLSNDVDIESDALGVTGVSQGDHGAAIIN